MLLALLLIFHITDYDKNSYYKMVQASNYNLIFVMQSYNIKMENSWRYRYT